MLFRNSTRTLVLVLAALGVETSALGTQERTPSGKVSGIVTFEDGAPATGAIVEWRSLDAIEGMLPDLLHENRVVCGKDGSFACTKMRKGPYRLEVLARPAKASCDSFVVVPEVKDGATDLKIVVKPGSAVSGRVLDAHGKPVATFAVVATQRYALTGSHARKSSFSGPPARPFQDPDGRFVFGGLPDGEWELSVVPPVGTESAPVKVTLPRKDEPIVLTRPLELPTRTIAGRVVDPKGAAVKGAVVRTSQPAVNGMISIGPGNREAKTDDQGNFRLDGLIEPRMRLIASATGWGDSEPVIVDLAQGPPKDLVLTLRACGTVKGVVVDAAGKPVASCSVAAYDDGDLDLLNAPSLQTDAQGSFEFKCIAPGSYDFSASTERSHPAGELFGTTAGEVKAGETIEIRVIAKKSP